MLVVVGVVVSLTVLANMLLELRVAIALRALLRVVVLIDILQMGVPAAETLQDLRHHPVKLRLAVVLPGRCLLDRHKDCLELVIRKHEQLPDGPTTLVGPLLHGRHQTLAAPDLCTDLVLRQTVTQQLQDLFGT